MRIKKFFLGFIALAASISTAKAVDANTVEIVYDGASATITIADNIKSYVTVKSGSSSHVILIQAEDFAGINPTASNGYGEIIYVLSGSSTNGQFYMEGSFKSQVKFDGLTLTNTTGPAVHIENGKRCEVTAKSGTVNTLTDANTGDEDHKGCFHCKGHTKFKGKGTLNIIGNNHHAVYSKEYVEVKNLTMNVQSSVKDGIHCKQYFLMESGSLTISGAGDDGIQVELKDEVSTGVTTDHEDEDTGNFYMTGGTLTITSPAGYAVKADGTINFTGGTRSFDTSNILENALTSGIDGVESNDPTPAVVYDLSGRQQPANIHRRGLYIIRENGKVRKIYQ